MGAPGFATYGGFVVEQEKDVSLIGREKYTTYANMLANTSIVAAGVRFFLNVVAKAGWKVEPADDSEEAKELAELVEDIMHDMVTPWSRVIRRAAMYRFYGFGIQEWTAKRREDGVIGMLDIEPRAQLTIEQWDVDEHGEVLGVVQRSPQTSRDHYLPRQKLVYMVDDSLHDNPEGLGLFRHLAHTAKSLKQFELLEAWGFETDLRGIPIGRAPLEKLAEMVTAGQITEEQARALRRPIEDFVKKHIKSPTLGLMIDSSTYKAEGENKTPSGTPQYDMQLLKGEGTMPHEDNAAAIERKNREMARVLGVEHLLLGSDSKGSHALSKDKTQSFGMIVDSTTNDIAEVMEKDFLGPLWRLNGWDEKLKPSFKVDAAQYRDIEQITGALVDLATAGAVLQPNDPAINQVRSLAGLVEMPEELMDEAALQLKNTANAAAGLGPDGKPLEEPAAGEEPPPGEEE